MTPVYPTGFWIVQGWYSKAYLFTNGQDITQFPIQTDMQAGRRWLRPNNESDIVDVPKYVVSPEGRKVGLGGYKFTWGLTNLSPQMTAYWFSTIFSNTYSQKFTLQGYNRATGLWTAYRAWGQFASVSSEAEAVAGGYNNLKIAFVNGSLAPTGQAMNIAVVHGADRRITLSIPTTITVSNVGDADNFGDVVVSWTVPSSCILLSTSGTGWVVSYSVNGGTSYSTTPPVDLTTVTNVKWEYDSAITSGGTAPVITLNWMSDIATSFVQTFNATSPYDSEIGTRTNTQTVVVTARAFSSGFSSAFGL